MTSIRTQVEIAAPPARVREVFLDFARIPEWSRGGIRGITPPAAKPAVEAGDTLTVALDSQSISTVVLENSAGLFRWVGSVPLLGSGTHSFYFEESKTAPGGTTFRNCEEFTGLLGLFVWAALQTKAEAGFQTFCDSLKERVESLK